MSPRSALLQSYCLALLRGARAWRRLADAEVKAFGLSEATAYPLMFIGRLGDGIRQSVLAEAIGIEKPSLVPLLDQLAESGLIERRSHHTDRRAKTLHLTAEGRSLTQNIGAKLDETRGDVFAAVSNAQLEAAIAVLSCLAPAPAASTTGESIP